MVLSPRALALALIGAAIAIGTIGAVSASGETGGHFTVESDPASIRLTEQGTHFLEYSVQGLNPIVCESAEYAGPPFSGKTKTEIGIGGLNKEPCKTKGGGAYGETTIHYNECKIVLLIGKKATQDNTTELECPSGGQLEITHPSCVIKVPAQKGFNGVAYNTVVEGGNHAITASFTVGGGTAHFENGFCVLLGTTHALAVTGSITMFAVDKNGAITGLTATGSEG
jgi:hypothetical protein